MPCSFMQSTLEDSIFMPLNSRLLSQAPTTVSPRTIDETAPCTKHLSRRLSDPFNIQSREHSRPNIDFFSPRLPDQPFRDIVQQPGKLPVLTTS